MAHPRATVLSEPELSEHTPNSWPVLAVAAAHDLVHAGWVLSLVGDSVSSSGWLGSWAWCVAEAGEVDGAGGVEGFLRGAGGEAGAQDGVLVAVVGGGVDREAEGMG